MVKKTKSLTSLLIEDGLVTQEQLREALEEKEDTGKSLARTLVEMGIVSEVKLTEVLANHLGLEFVDLGNLHVDMTAVALLDEKIASRHLTLPIGYEDDTLIVAMADPTNIFALDDVRMYTGHQIRPVVATKGDMQDAIRTYYRDSDDTVVEDFETDEMDESDLADAIGLAVDDAPIVKFVNYVINEAVTSGSSDIHFDPQEKEIIIRYRVDGVLHDMKSLPIRSLPALTSRVKIMSELNIAEKRIPQDGHYEKIVKGKPIDFRVAVLPTVFGEKIVLRVLDKSSILLHLSDLGYSGDTLATYEEAFRKPNGAILVTGPTGSGKSTTLYATLNVLNDETKNITTVEDPVEYRLAGINQIQINPKAGLHFSSALRSILRTSPDVIMVGEIRDLETAQVAIESALTGHLVFSTLHTNDAPGAVTRLTEMGIEPFLTASGIVCVLAQRLGRRLCTCKQEYEPEEELLERLEFPHEPGEKVKVFRPNPKGCARCSGTGYKGRIALVEIMTMTQEIEHLTIEEASTADIKRVAMEQGMKIMRVDGWEKVLEGTTSIEEVLRVVI
ncbi:MAG: Flp pilus assembly complex ATPase component TadA [Actinobacteria bacterium]|nr:Flp pilus assembly complex ATPase component TadA [Actinomycetota bacterium]